MAMAERTANCAWDGDLPHGSGKVSGASGALGELPVTWASRTERSDGQDQPRGADRRRARVVLTRWLCRTGSARRARRRSISTSARR